LGLLELHETKTGETTINSRTNESYSITNKTVSTTPKTTELQLKSPLYTKMPNY